MKASIAGAIVTAPALDAGRVASSGGFGPYPGINRANARLQAALLFLATVALLIPSMLADRSFAAAYIQKLSLGLAILLIVAYGLGLLFSLGTHRELFAGESMDSGEATWPMGLALGTLAGVTVLVALVSEIFVKSVPVGR